MPFVSKFLNKLENARDKHRMMSEWSSYYGPKNPFEAILLVGATQNADADLVAEMIPHNSYATDAIFQIDPSNTEKYLETLQVFLAFEINPLCDDMRTNAFARILHNAPAFKEVTHLIHRHYREFIPERLAQFLREEITNEWPKWYGWATGIDLLQSFFPQITPDLSSLSEENFVNIFPLLEKKFISRDEALNFIKAHFCGEKSFSQGNLFATVKKNFPEEFKEIPGTSEWEEKLLVDLSKKELSEKDFLLIRKQIKNDGGSIAKIFWRCCVNQQLLEFQRLLLISSFDEVTLSAGLMSMFGTPMGRMNVENVHILTKLLIDNGAVFNPDRFRDYTGIYLDQKLINVLVFSLSQERKDELRDKLTSFPNKYLAGRIAYSLNRPANS